MPSAPLWKQRRLAVRAKRVQARRSADSPIIGAYGSTLGPAADAYCDAYDLANQYESTWKRELGEGKGAVAKLLKTMQGWLPLLTRDVPKFDASDFGDQPGVPDDVIEDGTRLRAALETATGKDGLPLSYRDAAVAALTADLAAATKEWTEAEAADAAYQKMLGDVRTTAGAFDEELKAFRRSLVALFGRNDKDFQRLRADKVMQDDEDDAPPAEPSPPSPPTG